MQKICNLFITNFYSKNQQRETIGEIVRNQSLGDQYVQDFDSEKYLARGHLAPNAGKTDRDVNPKSERG